MVRDPQGTPQGGVISPLLANLYLHEMDRAFHEDKTGPYKVANARLVRYADDCAPRRRGKEAEGTPKLQPCCTEDEGRPLGAAIQVEASNHLKLL